MKIQRTKNTMMSIVFGTVYKIITIVLPFASRTVILYVLGKEYLGLSSLFSSILSFLSLAELGVGAAMIFSMYKPIAENDFGTMRALMNLYRKIYRIIGAVILGLGLVLMPFLKVLIKGDVPADINLYLLYFLYLFNSVLSYWLFAYKNAVIMAHQRNDINSKIGIVITPISYIVMLGSLIITKNYYAYVIWMPVVTIVTNILQALYVNKNFPELKPEGEVAPELKKSITKKVAALIGTKLNTIVLNAADNIVMSYFLGLGVIAVYGNYYYIMSSIITFLAIVYSSMTAGLGNSLVTENMEKNYNDFNKFSFINAWIVGWCSVCLACLYQPFMRIWVGGSMLFSTEIMLLFAVYFYIYQIRKIPITYKDAAGIWWEDRFRPYVCMVVNVVFNIVTVQLIGVAGIILSTVLSLVISIPWENYTIFKYVFKMSSIRYYLKMAYYFASTVLGGALTYYICSLLGDSIPWFLCKMAICVVVPNAVFIAANIKRREFKESIQFFKSLLKLKKQKVYE